MSYWPIECQLKCEWLSCLAGMGIAGNGHCFLNGAFWMPCCPNFIDEEDWIRRKGQ